MIYINDIPSFRNPDNGGDLLVDDRKQKIPLINGTAIQSGGVFFDGFSLTVVFRKDKFEQFKYLWLTNQKVSYTDKEGVVYSDLTIKVSKFGYVDHFERYVKVEFELWRENKNANIL